MSEWQYGRILQAVMALPWAIMPAKLAVIRDLLALRAAGERLSAEEIRERLAGEPVHAAAGSATSAGGGVMVLPLVGTIMPRSDMMTEMSGGVSLQRFTESFRQALADPNVSSIVMDVDSPGGQVGGVEELSAEIYRARGQKRIVAVANGLAASAAYWIGSAAGELVITPSGEVGSIGVFAVHEDVSQALVSDGVVMTLVSAGKYKVEGSPFGPLTEEARAAIQQRVDAYYSMFVSAVARNRGVKASDVRGGFGEGRMVGAKEAVGLGMADRVGTLDETISRLVGGRRRQSSAAASLDFRRRRLRQAAGAGSVEPDPTLR